MNKTFVRPESPEAIYLGINKPGDYELTHGWTMGLDPYIGPRGFIVPEKTKYEYTVLIFLQDPEDVFHGCGD